MSEPSAGDGVDQETSPAIQTQVVETTQELALPGQEDATTKSATAAAASPPDAATAAGAGGGKIQIQMPERPVRPLKDRVPTIEKAAPTAALSEKPKLPGKKVDITPAKKSVDIDEHLMSIAELATRYTTKVDEESPPESYGLAESAATQRLAENGPNMLTPPKRKSPIIQYLECLLALFNLLLIISGALVYLLYGLDPINNAPNVYLGAILIFVAFANAFIEFYQMRKVAAVLESFMNLIPQKCMVVREGKLKQMEAKNLVVGDIGFVRMGDKVPADMRVLSATDLKVDNSSLTGEADPQVRKPVNSATSPLEATNLMFNGTLATSGEGYGVVIRTGDNTVLGQIAGLTQGEKKNKSPLTVDVDKFVKIIAAIASTSAIIFFIIGMIIYDANINFNLTFAIGMLVAWVPQGLPATMTMLLTISANRMAAKSVLVKDLQGVETLGAITLLATDKTGTLTRNQMTVTNIWSTLNLYSSMLSGRSAAANGDADQITLDQPGIVEVLDICTLCSRTKFDRVDVPVDQRQFLGDATETGLLRFATKHIDVDKRREEHPKVFEIPFNSETKWHMSIHHKQHANGPLTLYIKGAPERVLRICTSILTTAGAIPLTDEHRKAYDETYEYMAGKGHRVLAFAQLLLPGDQFPATFEFDREAKNYPDTGLCFVGLVSLEDPPKHGVREAIGHCRSAGIQVMMVTGDHPLTAEAIARKINLMISETRLQVAKRLGRSEEDIQEHEYNAIVIHGEKIDSLSENDWDTIFSKNEIIFARTSPKHKLQIVKHAQGLGHIVGMTGDGVNDAPSLKKADLGISMNISGSDVSKEAAAMILLDDNFASTVAGIEEGRLIFANLKKSIQYTLTHSMPEVLPTLLFVLVPIPLPLSSILILVIDLGFELFAALSFAWEVPESKKGLMRLPPRKPVTLASVERLRRIESRRLQPVFDEETGDHVKASKLAHIAHWFRTRTSREHWRDHFSVEGDELIDGALLSWAYLEVGIIETLGCLLAYFLVLHSFGISPGDARKMQATQGNPYFLPTAPTYTLANGKKLDKAGQIEALAQAQSAYYLSVMISQAFNLFACKSRLRLPFGKFMVSNLKSFYGLTAGAALAFLIVYVPPINIAFGSSWHLSPLYLLVPIAFGVVIIVYATLRILALRKFRPTAINPEISGLQMYPTVRSFRRTASIPQP